MRLFFFFRNWQFATDIRPVRAILKLLVELATEQEMSTEGQTKLKIFFEQIEEAEAQTQSQRCGLFRFARRMNNKWRRIVDKW